MERALLLTAAGEERASWRGVPVKAAAEATKAKRRAKTVFMVLVVDSTDLPHEALEEWPRFASASGRAMTGWLFSASEHL